MATYTWTGAVNNEWDETGNWSTAVVPVADDTAEFNFSVSVNVPFASTVLPIISLTALGSTVTLSGSGSFDNSSNTLFSGFSVVVGATLVMSVPSTGNRGQLYGGGGSLVLAAPSTVEGNWGGASALNFDLTDAGGLGGGTLPLFSGSALNMNSLSVSNTAKVSIPDNLTVITGSTNSQALIILAGAVSLGFGLEFGVNGRIRVDGGTSLDFNGNGPPATIQLNGGSVSNSAGFIGVVDILGGAAYTYGIGDLDNASVYVINGGTFDGNATDFSATGKTFSLGILGGSISNGIYEAANFLVLIFGTINGTIVGGTLTKNSFGSVTLSGVNTHSATDIISGTFIATNANAFGNGQVTTGVIFGSQGTVNLGGQPIGNQILANNGLVLGGNVYAGTLSVPALGVAELGAATAGIANVAATGRLKVNNPHTGLVNNDGIAEINLATAGPNPLKTYVASCGSSYVRAG